ncbi:MAG: cell division protein SepF [archaeon]|nr:cell division protein SepF [archaeon]MCR4324005.1 cell division protein SepF [Nanoarchaeota archaeon]
MGWFSKVGGKGGEETSDFIEIDLASEKSASKIIVKTFTLKVYEDINPILNALRGGYTIAVIDIRALKSKDVVELKRAISKIKKTVEALEGKIAGFGDNTVIATPSNVFDIEKGFSEEREVPKKDDLGRY